MREERRPKMSTDVRLADGRNWDDLTLAEQGDLALKWLIDADTVGIPVVEWLAEKDDEEALSSAA